MIRTIDKMTFRNVEILEECFYLKDGDRVQCPIDQLTDVAVALAKLFKNKAEAEKNVTD